MPALAALHDDDRAARRAFDRIVETLIFLYTESRRLTKEEARKHELTGPQLTVLKLLAGIDHLSLTALSESMQTRNSTVSGIIDRMEDAGLVKRVRSDRDRRVVRIRLTPAGRKLANAVPIEPMQVFRQALETLSTAEHRALFRLLSKLEEQVRAQLPEARVARTSPAPARAAQGPATPPRTRAKPALRTQRTDAAAPPREPRRRSSP